MLSRFSALVGSSTSSGCFRILMASSSASRTKWRPVLPGVSDCHDQKIFMGPPLDAYADIWFQLTEARQISLQAIRVATALEATHEWFDGPQEDHAREAEGVDDLGRIRDVGSHPQCGNVHLGICL